VVILSVKSIFGVMGIVSILVMSGFVCLNENVSADEDMSVLGAEDSLFLVIPAEHRLIFPFGNPILFGVSVVDGTILTYRMGSGLTGILTLSIHDGSQIYHMNAPDVDENTSFIFIIDAYNEILGSTETLELLILIGEYGIAIGEPEDEDVSGIIPEDVLSFENAFYFLLFIIGLLLLMMVLSGSKKNGRKG